ncbi:Uncharacterized protein BM_BM7759 [Brugia malayi]|nr:Uncharacterized protein BM_BM7759 [Brugia malayi]CDQ06289.1 Bm7759 [Brugia malayi]VIO92083.1 Uncharacterized protein BM_BM7759 [Brugia malayi]
MKISLFYSEKSGNMQPPLTVTTYSAGGYGSKIRNGGKQKEVVASGANNAIQQFYQFHIC